VLHNITLHFCDAGPKVRSGMPEPEKEEKLKDGVRQAAAPEPQASPAVIEPESHATTRPRRLDNPEGPCRVTCSGKPSPVSYNETPTAWRGSPSIPEGICYFHFALAKECCAAWGVVGSMLGKFLHNIIL